MQTNTCSLTYQAHQRQQIFWSWLDRAVRQLVTELIERMLRAAQEAHLQAGWNQRSPERNGYRNGFYHRGLMTAHGPLRIRVPRTRSGSVDTGVIFQRYQRRVADVERILRHAYLLGCATRPLARLAEQIFGGSVSHQTVSSLMRWVDQQLLQWRNQPIEPVYPVVYIDGMHVDMRGSDRMVMLAAGMREDGRMDVLGFCVSRGERCTELLADLRRRGLEGVRLFVSDDSGAIASALEQVYPLVARQDCIYHRLSRLRLHIGSAEYRDRMVAEAGCVFRCPSRQAAFDTAARWRRRWQPISPWAVDRFLEGLSDSLNFYELPKKWWRRTRTNNPLERLIRTLRQRLRPMGCFQNKNAIERAAFGQLLRWQKIKLTHNT